MHNFLGRESAVHEFEWTPNDVMLYAIAVGAGQQDPNAELRLTTENSDGVTLVTLPAFANIITRNAKVDLEGLDLTKLVHAKQTFTLHRRLSSAGRAEVTARITEVWDKESGALVTITSKAVDARNGEPIATTEMFLFIRGAGGFGGERGPSSSWTAPNRIPDLRTRFATRPEQALMYRLTGDHNPLHSDPSYASRSGFARPILHGMCTYGYVSRILYETYCRSGEHDLRAMEARFANPVYPGDELDLTAWRDGNEVKFVVSMGSSTVVDQGTMKLVPCGAG